mmetsp:Transcript_27544/g.71462  ORF Transcript_27544/g.71462 Transcript_27544/m.71462 type:complete len:558 (-) Transcript_27544:13-1686(-)
MDTAQVLALVKDCATEDGFDTHECLRRAQDDLGVTTESVLCALAQAVEPAAALWLLREWAASGPAVCGRPGPARLEVRTLGASWVVEAGRTARDVLAVLAQHHGVWGALYEGDKRLYEQDAITGHQLRLVAEDLAVDLSAGQAHRARAILARQDPLATAISSVAIRDAANQELLRVQLMALQQLPCVSSLTLRAAMLETLETLDLLPIPRTVRALSWTPVCSQDPSPEWLANFSALHLRRLSLCDGGVQLLRVLEAAPTTIEELELGGVDSWRDGVPEVMSRFRRLRGVQLKPGWAFEHWDDNDAAMLAVLVRLNRLTSLGVQRASNRMLEVVSLATSLQTLHLEVGFPSSSLAKAIAACPDLRSLALAMDVTIPQAQAQEVGVAILGLTRLLALDLFFVPETWVDGVVMQICRRLPRLDRLATRFCTVPGPLGQDEVLELDLKIGSLTGPSPLPPLGTYIRRLALRSQYNWSSRHHQLCEVVQSARVLEFLELEGALGPAEALELGAALRRLPLLQRVVLTRGHAGALWSALGSSAWQVESEKGCDVLRRVRSEGT